MNNELWATIRRMKNADGLTMREIARALRVHRKTVRRALESETGAPANSDRGPRAGAKLEPYKPYLKSRLEEYPDLKAIKLLKEIRQRGYAGGHTVLKDYLHGIRAGRQPASFLRLETQPGEFAQVDWANIGNITIGNARRQLSCFVMVLSYSRMIYIEFTLSQKIEDFLAAHVSAFKYFGGIPKSINYDNLKSVVLERSGAAIRYNPRFLNFSGYYMFNPIPCGVRKPNEKGKVESGIKYVRTAFLAGREITSHTKIQQEALEWLDLEANVRVHGTTHEQPMTRFQSEKDLLMPLSMHDYDCSIVTTAIPTSQALVHFDGNRYSVPSQFVGRMLTIKATARQVAVYDKDRILTSHPRSYEKYRVIENPKHYENLLAHRKKARTSKLVEWFLALSADCERYLKGLVAAELHLSGQLDKIQKMAGVYGKSDVVGAIGHALGYNAFGAHYIQNIISQRRAARNMPEPRRIVLTKKPQWSEASVEESDLGQYDELFKENNHD